MLIIFFSHFKVVFLYICAFSVKQRCFILLIFIHKQLKTS